MKLMVFFLAVIMLAGVESAAEPLKMVYSSKGKPLCWGERDEVKGILVEIATQAFLRLGVPATHEGYPWIRAQKRVKDGDADAFITIPTPERRLYTEVGTESVITMNMVMVIQADSPKLEQLKAVKTVADLASFRVLSYNGNSWAKGFLKDLEVTWAMTVEQCLRMLSRDRGDVYISDENSERYRIKKLGFDQQLLILPTVLDQRNFYLCMGKTSGHVPKVSKFDKAIQQMKAEGVVQHIIDTYFHMAEQE